MSVLDYAIRIIKATMKNHSNESFFLTFSLLVQEYLCRKYLPLMRLLMNVKIRAKSLMRYHIFNLKMKLNLVKQIL